MVAIGVAPVPTNVALQGLEPETLWTYFEQLSSIPRPSKQEGKVLAWLQQWAEERALEWQQDAAGNMVIRRPGSGGGEHAPTVVLQGHVDMVCEKNKDVSHDFTRDGIRLIRDGDWIKADGTTLGADNGIGVCAALALLDAPPAAKLPPLEALFTVDEEEGLTGAAALDGGMVRGRIMLNLDTEDWGDIFIGCAGGGDTLLTLPVQREAAPEGYAHCQVAAGGLLGGHSGLDIAEGRANALRLAADACMALLRAHPGAVLVRISGGDKSNAIARECAATLLLPSGEVEAATSLTEARAAACKAEFGSTEAGLHVSLAPAHGPYPARALSRASASALLGLLLALPHGVERMSDVVPGLVETSNNVASVHEQGDGTYSIATSTRSSLAGALEALRDRIEAMAVLAGAGVARQQAFPGWAPNPDSRILALTKSVFAQVLGSEPNVQAIHAGLECGILGERVPGLDCVSFGPTIRGAHSPDERCLVHTVPPFYAATLKILAAIVDGRY